MLLFCTQLEKSGLVGSGEEVGGSARNTFSIPPVLSTIKDSFISHDHFTWNMDERLWYEWGYSFLWSLLGRRIALDTVASLPHCKTQWVIPNTVSSPSVKTWVLSQFVFLWLATSYLLARFSTILEEKIIMRRRWWDKDDNWERSLLSCDVCIVRAWLPRLLAPAKCYTAPTDISFVLCNESGSEYLPDPSTNANTFLGLSDWSRFRTHVGKPPFWKVVIGFDTRMG